MTPEQRSIWKNYVVASAGFVFIVGTIIVAVSAYRGLVVVFRR